MCVGVCVDVCRCVCFGERGESVYIGVGVGSCVLCECCCVLGNKSYVHITIIMI